MWWSGTSGAVWSPGASGVVMIWGTFRPSTSSFSPAAPVEGKDEKTQRQSATTVLMLARKANLSVCT